MSCHRQNCPWPERQKGIGSDIWWRGRKGDPISCPEKAERLLKKEQARQRQVQETIQMGPGRPVYTVHTTDAPQETEPDFKKILREFVQDIDTTGGVCKYGDTDDYAPVADKDWTDLGETYLKACKALRRRPHVKKED
jgi:hypothetical protein